jgi:hypothetical protein
MAAYLIARLTLKLIRTNPAWRPMEIDAAAAGHLIAEHLSCPWRQASVDRSTNRSRFTHLFQTTYTISSCRRHIFMGFPQIVAS